MGTRGKLCLNGHNSTHNDKLNSLKIMGDKLTLDMLNISFSSNYKSKVGSRWVDPGFQCKNLGGGGGHALV